MWLEKDCSYLFLKESEHFSFLFWKMIDWNYSFKVCKCGWCYREPKSVYSTVTMNCAILVIKAKFHISYFRNMLNKNPTWCHFIGILQLAEWVNNVGGTCFLLFCSLPWELKRKKAWQHCALRLSAGIFLFYFFYQTYKPHTPTNAQKQ